MNVNILKKYIQLCKALNIEPTSENLKKVYLILK